LVDTIVTHAIAVLKTGSPDAYDWQANSPAALRVLGLAEELAKPV
jgi:hypothetical protein